MRAAIAYEALIDRLNQPSGPSEDEKVKLASTVIQRAVYRIPNTLGADRGRAINSSSRSGGEASERRQAL
jgi:hypothetical protein